MTTAYVGEFLWTQKKADDLLAPSWVQNYGPCIWADNINMDLNEIGFQDEKRTDSVQYTVAALCGHGTELQLRETREIFLTR